MKTVRFVFALHNHQPVGNFDGVFEAAYQDSYRPFLETISRYPAIPFVLHTSGSLLEWIVAHHPEYIQQLQALHRAGQVEIMGGGFYEPILTMIPSRDRQGQIRSYSEYLEGLFGSPIRGMWVPERVWEQALVSDIVAAGIQYTVLDDTHFRFAGLESDQLWGYYLTEDSGQVLRIFPGSERMRYLVPFQPVEETIRFLRERATDDGRAVVVLADDGEKFGTWPKTHKHVYDDGWLVRFFEALTANADWIRVQTFSQVIDQVEPLGKIYLPDASYREMTEWALPTQPQKVYHRVSQQLEGAPEGQAVKRFLRGGFWRNFKVKYPESDEMYARMLEVSALADSLSNGRPEAAVARRELYRAQCNCAYWHGAFGGLYLPHLREAVYRHLIAAETAVEQVVLNDPQWVSSRIGDFNLDARPEIRLANAEVVAYLRPAEGGHLYELDLKPAGVNLLATLSRRPEAYHEQVVEAARGDGRVEVASIHDIKAVKQPDLDKHLVYDPYPRKALVDLFFDPEETLERVAACQAALRGDFAGGRYEFFTHRGRGRVSATLTRLGEAYGRPLRVTKRVTVAAGRRGLEVRYELVPSGGEGQPLHFGVELNFAGLPGGAPDRYFRTDDGRLGPLETRLDLPATPKLALVDEWRGLEVVVHTRPAAAIWTFPIQTVSQSESGFELVHQSTAVLPHWRLAAGPEPVRLGLSLEFRRRDG